jgi:hypothetical protein
MSSDADRDSQAAGTDFYEIRVAGRLGTEWSDWFAGLRVTVEDGDTLLGGPLDQAALHGVLRRVRDLGLPLISVERVEATRIEPAPTARPNPHRATESNL